MASDQQREYRLVSSCPSTILRSPFSVLRLGQSVRAHVSLCLLSVSRLARSPLGRRVPQCAIRTLSAVVPLRVRVLVVYCSIVWSAVGQPLPLPSPHLSLHLRNSSIFIAVGRRWALAPRRATIKRGSASSASGPAVSGQPAGNTNTFLCGQQRATHQLANCNRVSWSEDPPPALPERENLKWSIVTRTNNGDE